MLTQKNKRIVVLTVFIFICFAFTVYSEAADEVSGADIAAGNIDIAALAQDNPFARFTQPATGASPAQQISSSQPKPDLFVKTVTLRFLDATSLAESIENMLTEWGKMEPDAGSNSLIICDTDENLEKILKQIAEADKRPGQIMIEVVLVDVKLNDDTEIGINWDMLLFETDDSLIGSDRTTFRQNVGFTSRLASTPDDSTTNGIAKYLTTGTGADFSIFWGDIRNVIHMLQEKNNVEILASPRVMVVSGKTASIEAVEEIPYSEVTDTDGGGTLESTAFKDVGVKLDVTATLTDDSSILMTIASEQKVETGTSSTEVPIVDARTIETSLFLEDGQLLVIGGLRRKQTQKQTEQLPILGDLPVVGNAFKSTLTTQYSSELVVILSPHIYKGEILTARQMKKFNDITKQPLLTIPEVEELEQKKKEQEEKDREKETKEKAKLSKKEEKERRKAEKKRAEMLKKEAKERERISKQEAKEKKRIAEREAKEREKMRKEAEAERRERISRAQEMEKGQTESEGIFDVLFSKSE